MMIPIRCFTCGAPLADKWDEFKKRVEAGESPSKVLDDLGVRRYCCRKTLISHVELIQEIARLSRIS